MQTLLARGPGDLVAAIDAIGSGGINGRQVDKIDTLHEVAEDVRRARAAVRNRIEQESVNTQSTRHDICGGATDESVGWQHGSQLYGVVRPMPLDIHEDAAHAPWIIGLDRRR
jgi:hypothetical protein